MNYADSVALALRMVAGRDILMRLDGRATSKAVAKLSGLRSARGRKIGSPWFGITPRRWRYV